MQFLLTYFQISTPKLTECNHRNIEAKCDCLLWTCDFNPFPRVLTFNVPDKQLRLLLAVSKKPLHLCKCTYGKYVVSGLWLLALGCYLLCKHSDTFCLVPQLTWYRTELKLISQGFECKVYPGFQCKSTAKRHSSHFVGAHRKKMHVRERAVIPIGRLQLNTCGIYDFL